MTAVSDDVEITTTPLTRFFASVGMCIVWLCLLSDLALWMCEQIASLLNVQEATAGVVIVAWGVSVPDLLTSMILARNGMGDGAVANAIGGQVINVTFGIAAPALVYSIVRNDVFSIDTSLANDLGILSVLLMVTISTFLVVVLPLKDWFVSCTNTTRTHIDRNGAIVLIATCLACYMAFIINVEGGIYNII